MRKRTIGIVVAAVTLAGAATAFVTSAAAGEPAVKTAKVERGTLSLTLTVSGRTEAGKKSEVFAPVAGTLKGVAVDDGQRVKKGQVLAILDRSKLDAQVKTAQAQYDGAAAQVRALSRRRTVEVPVPATPDAPATTQTKTVPEDPASEAQRQSARAQRRQAAVQLRMAKDDRDKAVLRAPSAGVVTFEPVGAPGPDGSVLKPVAGAPVTPQGPLFTIVDARALKFVADVDEADVSRIHGGDKVTVTLESFPGMDFPTNVKTIVTTAVKTKEGATVFPTTMPLAGVKRGRVGMTGNALIEVEAVKDALKLPAEALFEADGRSYVYVVKNGELVERDIELGAMTDTHFQVVKGLSEGETVALGTAGQLKAGMKVEEETR